MQLYRLLRSNKESGPFTADQMIATGFKPYDLVWADGKSAGWRYPSEFPEFAPHSPAVEEDLFTLFYKRPTPEKQVSTKQNAVNQPYSSSIPVVEPPVTPVSTNENNKNEDEITESQPVSPHLENIKVVEAGSSVTHKKIHITLPKSNTNANTPPTPYSTTQQAAPSPQPSTTTAAKAAEKTTLPTVAPKKKRKKFSSRPEPVKKADTSVSPEPDDEIKVNDQKTYTGNDPKSSSKRRSSNLMLGIVFLFGVVTLVALGWLIGASVNRKDASIEEIVQNAKPLTETENNSRYSQKQSDEESTDEEKDQESPTASVEDPVSEEKPSTAAIISEKKLQASTQKISPSTNNSTATQHASNNENIEPNAGYRNKNNTDKEGENNTPNAGNYNNLIEVTTNTYTVGTFGGIYNLQCIVANKSSISFETVEVSVDYVLANKKVYKTEVLSFKNVRAGEKLIIEAPKSSRGIKVVSKLVKATAVQKSISAPLKS